MRILHQHTSQAGKSPLERLPVELFRQITSYLAFFDKKAIQVTSKRCYTLTGSFMCPHILLWLLHCCRSGIPSCPSSNLKSDVIKLNALTSDCLTRDTWIDLSQGQETQDAHLAFLDQWNAVSPPEISDSSRRCIVYLLSLELKASGWQQTIPLETRFAVLQKMFSNLSLLNSNHSAEKIMDEATAFEKHQYGRAPNRAAYEDECRRTSSVYISPILQPYFNAEFPKSTVAHMCFNVVIEIAESMFGAHLVDTNDVDLSEQLEEKAQWHRILLRARAYNERLDIWTRAEGRTRFSKKILLRL